MRPLKIKDRCTKKKIKKCEEVIRTYDKIQTAYAEILDKDEAIKSIQCILSMKESLIGKRKGVFGDELELVIMEITSGRLVIQKYGVSQRDLSSYRKELNISDRFYFVPQTKQRLCRG